MVHGVARNLPVSAMQHRELPRIYRETPIMSSSGLKFASRAKRLRSTALALCLSIGWSHNAQGQSQQDFLLFTSIDAFKITSGSVTGLDNSFVRPTIDFLYSYSGDRFRFLGEYLLSNDENELERLKAGWQMGDNSMIWLGRFHSSAKYWTSEYHHGQFLQTSITRPSIDEWEDESGPMPSHITGLSLQHRSLIASDSSINYTFSVGLAPQFSDEELVPFDLLNPESGHDLGLTFGMQFKPKVLSESQFGLLMAWNDINVVSESNPALANLNRIKQFTLGLSADWSRGPLRLISSFVYFNNDMQYVDGSVEDDFIAGYLQAEYKTAKDWTIFGRGDLAFDEDQSPYLSLLPVFIAHRNMLGLRWDFKDLQSLAMEIADSSSQGNGLSHQNFKEVRVQWSAVFP